MIINSSTNYEPSFSFTTPRPFISSFIRPFLRSQLTSLLVPRDTNLKGETMTREAIHLRGKERE